MDLWLAMGGGFLVAVLWMDLMFDVASLGPRTAGCLPEETLVKVAAYYRRVTTEAAPMDKLIGLVMASMVAVLLEQAARGPAEGRMVALGSLALCGVPIVLALGHIFPAARRLGARQDGLQEQTQLARGIAHAHLACLGAMAAFLAVRLLAAG